MGSHFKALTVNMKTFLLAFTLLMLGLYGSKADKVTSCLQCITVTGVSEDSECIGGTGKGTACGVDAVGCYVQVAAGSTVGVDVATWNRGCCIANSGLCTEIHEEQEQGGASVHVDQVGCTTNDCNTMDPRTPGSSASTLVPALTILLVIVAVMA